MFSPKTNNLAIRLIDCQAIDQKDKSAKKGILVMSKKLEDNYIIPIRMGETECNGK
jgi:hypothetical protein